MLFRRSSTEGRIAARPLLVRQIGIWLTDSFKTITYSIFYYFVAKGFCCLNIILRQLHNEFFFLQVRITYSFCKISAFCIISGYFFVSEKSLSKASVYK